VPIALPFWSKRRPRYLFSGLMCCGVCGGGFSKISEAHFGCSTARNKGETVCANRLTIRRDALETIVMDGLRKRLMDPALFKIFAREFAAEWNRLQAEAGAHLSRARSERGRVCRQIDRLVHALADGEPVERLKGKLEELERQRLELEHELATADAPAPRLHPNIAEVYRRKVGELHGALKEGDAGPARELVRGLVEAIVLIPENGRLRVEVRGQLAAILRLSGLANEKAPAGSPELLAEQIKLVAGARFEPATLLPIPPTGARKRKILCPLTYATRRNFGAARIFTPAKAHFDVLAKASEQRGLARAQLDVATA